jgi:hypothetical protein
MNTESSYFLLVYNKSSGELEIEEFAADADRAAAEYGQRERRFRDRSEIEVVLVGADSLDTVKKTHSHYFRRPTKAIVSDLEHRLNAA